MKEYIKSFFAEHNIGVEEAVPEVGKLYPIFGYITDVISEEEDKLVIEVNFHMKVTIFIEDREKVNTIKERSFEPGIFFVTFTSVQEGYCELDHNMEAECKTVIFGRKNQEGEI